MMWLKQAAALQAYALYGYVVIVQRVPILSAIIEEPFRIRILCQQNHLKLDIMDYQLSKPAIEERGIIHISRNIYFLYVG